MTTNIGRPCIHRNPDGTGCTRQALPGKARCQEHQRQRWREEKAPSTIAARDRNYQLIRQRMIKQLPLVCHICGGIIHTADELEVDHRIAVVEGGHTDPYNCRPAHAVCNHRKNMWQ